MGKPGWGHAQSSFTEYIGVGGEPGELKHLSTWRKGNQNETPQVAASERGIAQTGGKKFLPGLWDLNVGL